MPLNQHVNATNQPQNITTDTGAFVEITESVVSQSLMHVHA